ncbi:MAG: SRPBCC family protein [Saprospiraceae bacterium]
MNSITVRCQVQLEPETAFSLFLKDFSKWWPKEYTWSQKHLEEIMIEPKVGGHCIEKGPGGFRSDWGTVTDLVVPDKISFLWQISPQREPVPNPAKASQVHITFLSNKKNGTTVSLVHSDFKNHGEGYNEYLENMNSKYGWPFILSNFESYCNSNGISQL